MKLGSACMTDSSKGEDILCLRIIKTLGAWDIVRPMYGNLEPFGFLTSLTFKYTNSWIPGEMSELVSL